MVLLNNKNVNRMKTPKIGLLGKIVIAIALGVGLGMIVPEWTVRLFLTFNGISFNAPGFIMDGKIAAPVRYEQRPAKTVEP